MESMIFARRPDDGVDVTKIPTPPLQAAALLINFFFPATALILVVLRGYSRIKMQQLGTSVDISVSSSSSQQGFASSNSTSGNEPISVWEAEL
ncbi:CFEM domain-containing protein [Seiridium cupressi]